MKFDRNYHIAESDLERCIEYKRCDNCNYRIFTTDTCRIELMKSALELIKHQREMLDDIVGILE